MLFEIGLAEIGNQKNRNILEIVIVARPVQIDEVDLLLLLVVDNIVGIEVSVDEH